MDKHINVIDYEHLECILLDNLDENGSASLVSDFNTVWNVAMDFVKEDIEFEFIDLNTDYEKEYYLTLMEDEDGEVTMGVERAFCDGKYLATDGLVFVEDTVNPKYFSDMRSNKIVKDFVPIVFSFGSSDEEDEDDTVGCEDCLFGKEVDGSQVHYFIPVCMNELVKAFDNLMNKHVEDNFR